MITVALHGRSFSDPNEAVDIGVWPNCRGGWLERLCYIYIYVCVCAATSTIPNKAVSFIHGGWRPMQAVADQEVVGYHAYESSAHSAGP